MEQDFKEKKESRERTQRKMKAIKATTISKPSGHKGTTIENVRKRRERHLVRYPNDKQALNDIKNCSRWKEAMPRGL